MRKNVAIYTNKSYDQCETFIKAQIDLLPYEITHYWGTKLPLNISVPKSGFLQRQLHKFNIIPKKSFENIVIDDFKKNKITLVLAQYGMMGVQILPVCKALNIPLIVHFHGHDSSRKSVLNQYQESYQKMFSYSKIYIISVSNEMTKRLKLMGCPENKIYYNPCGANNLFLKIKPNFSKQQFISIGRFVEKKAPHLTILAFKEVLNAFPNAKLIYAGDGYLRDSCIDLIKALKIEDNVILPGRIPAVEYANYLQDSVAYVQHSIEAQDGDMEGTPVSILEASAAGLPVISTFHAGIPDVIKHKETGLLCKERDIGEMSNYMITVIENIELAKLMGEKGKRLIGQDFSMEKHIEGLKSIIDIAMNET
jgi:colanic acid/amylovoran biosynthesis glycosyltransferase